MGSTAAEHAARGMSRPPSRSRRRQHWAAKQSRPTSTGARGKFLVDEEIGGIRGQLVGFRLRLHSVREDGEELVNSLLLLPLHLPLLPLPSPHPLLHCYSCRQLAWAK